MIVGDPKSRAELTEFFRSTRASNPRLAPIGSTDYHFRQPMGLCRTYVFAREYSSAWGSRCSGPWRISPRNSGRNAGQNVDVCQSIH